LLAGTDSTHYSQHYARHTKPTKKAGKYSHSPSQEIAGEVIKDNTLVPVLFYINKCSKASAVFSVYSPFTHNTSIGMSNSALKLAQTWNNSE